MVRLVVRNFLDREAVVLVNKNYTRGTFKRRATLPIWQAVSVLLFEGGMF